MFDDLVAGFNWKRENFMPRCFIGDKYNFATERRNGFFDVAR